MAGTKGLRIGVVGATGSLATEVLECLSLSSLRISEIVPIATEESVGTDIEFQGTSYPAETDPSRLTSLDLMFLCAPAAVAFDYVRLALEEKIPCIDLSGATLGSDGVPIRVAGYGAVPTDAPLIAVPNSPALALIMALQPIDSAFGLTRVSATVLESASVVGKEGLSALYQESIAILGQTASPEPTVFPGGAAFDCTTGTNDLDSDGRTRREALTIDTLGLLLGKDFKMATTFVQVPTFVGLGAALNLETRNEITAGAVAELLGKAPGVEVWPGADAGPGTRSATGLDRVLVGRLRQDSSRERSLQLWVVADPICLAASHAVQLAAMRLG
jgi:aspartate-semialdehyde dehydrogenase